MSQSVVAAQMDPDLVRYVTQHRLSLLLNEVLLELVKKKPADPLEGLVDILSMNGDTAMNVHRCSLDRERLLCSSGAIEHKQETDNATLNTPSNILQEIEDASLLDGFLLLLHEAGGFQFVDDEQQNTLRMNSGVSDLRRKRVAEMSHSTIVPTASSPREKTVAAKQLLVRFLLSTQATTIASRFEARQAAEVPAAEKSQSSADDPKDISDTQSYMTTVTQVVSWLSEQEMTDIGRRDALNCAGRRASSGWLCEEVDNSLLAVLSQEAELESIASSLVHLAVVLLGEEEDHHDDATALLEAFDDRSDFASESTHNQEVLTEKENIVDSSDDDSDLDPTAKSPRKEPPPPPALPPSEREMARWVLHCCRTLRASWARKEQEGGEVTQWPTVEKLLDPLAANAVDSTELLGMLVSLQGVVAAFWGETSDSQEEASNEHHRSTNATILDFNAALRTLHSPLVSERHRAAAFQQLTKLAPFKMHLNKALSILLHQPHAQPVAVKDAHFIIVELADSARLKEGRHEVVLPTHGFHCLRGDSNSLGMKVSTMGQDAVLLVTSRNKVVPLSNVTVSGTSEERHGCLSPAGTRLSLRAPVVQPSLLGLLWTGAEPSTLVTLEEREDDRTPVSLPSTALLSSCWSIPALHSFLAQFLDYRFVEPIVATMISDIDVERPSIPLSSFISEVTSSDQTAATFIECRSLSASTHVALGIFAAATLQRQGGTQFPTHHSMLQADLGDRAWLPVILTVRSRLDYAATAAKGGSNLPDLLRSVASVDITHSSAPPLLLIVESPTPIECQQIMAATLKLSDHVIGALILTTSSQRLRRSLTETTTCHHSLQFATVCPTLNKDQMKSFARQTCARRSQDGISERFVATLEQSLPVALLNAENRSLPPLCGSCTPLEFLDMASTLILDDYSKGDALLFGGSASGHGVSALGSSEAAVIHQYIEFRLQQLTFREGGDDNAPTKTPREDQLSVSAAQDVEIEVAKRALEHLAIRTISSFSHRSKTEGDIGHSNDVDNVLTVSPEAYCFTQEDLDIVFGPPVQVESETEKGEGVNDAQADAITPGHHPHAVLVNQKTSEAGITNNKRRATWSHWEALLQDGITLSQQHGSSSSLSLGWSFFIVPSKQNAMSEKRYLWRSSTICDVLAAAALLRSPIELLSIDGLFRRCFFSNYVPNMLAMFKVLFDDQFVATPPVPSEDVQPPAGNSVLEQRNMYVDTLRSFVESNYTEVEGRSNALALLCALSRANHEHQSLIPTNTTTGSTVAQPQPALAGLRLQGLDIIDCYLRGADLSVLHEPTTVVWGDGCELSVSV